MDSVKRLLEEIPHWCSLHKAGWIFDKVIESKPELCVEIGVYGGGSFFAFAFALKGLGKGKLVGIDPWTCESALQGIGDDVAMQIDFESIYSHFMKIRERENLTGITHVIRDRAENAHWFFNDNYKTENVLIDILHIDGNHATESVISDLKGYLPHMKQNGTIIIDDINWPTVIAAVKQFPQLKQVHDFITWGVYELTEKENC
jgi:predicted O-methyltransferase YrrM